MVSSGYDMAAMKSKIAYKTVGAFAPPFSPSQAVEKGMHESQNKRFELAQSVLATGIECRIPMGHTENLH